MRESTWSRITDSVKAIASRVEAVGDAADVTTPMAWPTGHIDLLVELRDAADDALFEEVALARRRNVTWSAIAAPFGRARQTIQDQYAAADVPAGASDGSLFDIDDVPVPSNTRRRVRGRRGRTPPAGA